MKKALITGYSGQDGSLLAELLLHKNYQVMAITNHDLGPADSKFSNYKDSFSQVSWKAFGLSEQDKLNEFFKSHVPDEVYHLGAQSFPSAGFDSNYGGFQANTEGVYNLLASVYKTNPEARFFFAGSAEIFGDNPKLVMNEDDRFYPKTVYGISKLMGHELVRNYRENMQKFALTGFLFNHESPRRGEEFVTRKITLAAAKIKLGLQKKLVLGSLDSKRDWSAAEDFVEGFHMALNTSTAKDYVFSSGEIHTVREFVELAFSALGLKYEDYIEIDQKFNRPAKYELSGDSTRAMKELGWKPKHSFESIVQNMVKSDYDLLSAK